MDTNHTQSTSNNRISVREVAIRTFREKFDLLRLCYRFIVIAICHWLQFLLSFCCPHRGIEPRNYAQFGCPACAAWMSLHWHLQGYYGWRAKSKHEEEQKEKHWERELQ